MAVVVFSSGTEAISSESLIYLVAEIAALAQTLTCSCVLQLSAGWGWQKGSIARQTTLQREILLERETLSVFVGGEKGNRKEEVDDFFQRAEFPQQEKQNNGQK